MSTVAKEINAAKEPKQSIWKGVKRVRISDFVIAFVILILSLTCILPFLHVATKSVSSNNAVLSKSVYLWPKEFSLDAYTAIFKDGQLTHSMWYTILVTVLFTVIGMFVTTLAAYPLSVRSLKGRVTVILTTHYLEEAEALSDRVGIMKDGHLLAVGTAAELKSQTGRERFEDAFVAIVKEGEL